MANENAITNILFIVLAVMMTILFILVITFIVLRIRMNKKPKEKNEKIKMKNKKEKKSSTLSPELNKQSIYDFMEFDKIEDSMIVQKAGKRYIMVVECQGVNYDLMSGVEKVSVEEGFQQFLNTLRHPIQIYIQTRTINLENSINKYKERVKEIEDKYRQMEYEYNKMAEEGIYTREELEKQFFELTKQKNMLEYSRDLINNTERMSLNRNVLNKKYYIVISYYPEEANNEKYAIEEIKNMAFSELYTRAQAIIRTLSVCSVGGKILNSKELVELLYVAYNRDESETFGIERALRSGYEDLYTTAMDVYEKKIKVLDKEIEERAVDLANEKIDKVKSRNQKAAEEREASMEDLISKMAEIILEENKRYVGEDVAEEAIEEIKEDRQKGENSKEKEASKDEKIKKTTRGRKKKTA